ncbi:MAG: prohead protease, partial [Deltaproteobacteria bacterium]|nr:prohead protease [Deltaproteobacteria bacterium]
QRRDHLRPSETYWLLKGFSDEGLIYVMSICRNQIGKQAVSSYVTQLRKISTYIHGADLKNLGYPPGPGYQTMLNHLLEAKLDGQVHSRKDEIQLLKEHYPLDDA